MSRLDAVTTPDPLDLFSAILRDRPFVWPDVDAAGARGLDDAARRHGVHLLIAERLWQRGVLDDCPPSLRDPLVVSLRHQLVVEEIARQELRDVLAELADAGIRPLLFKGTALAFTHYPDPALRPRIDTDLLVDESEIHSTSAMLDRLGYRRGPSVTGELVIYQAQYGKTGRHGVRHTLDLHWKVSNPQVFAHALTNEELRASAVDVPALGAAARAIGPVYALALACMHPVAHHGNEERLIWIYDIHLLAERLTATEQARFVGFAVAKRLTAVCAHGLALAERRLHGRGARVLSARLAACPSTGHEPSDTYVLRTMRQVDVLRSDLEALEGWGPRMKLLWEHLFPPRAYMREAYGVSSPALLPLLYAWRVARGARKWCRRPAR